MSLLREWDGIVNINVERNVDQTEYAFPFESVNRNHCGMSLRDYFAAAALTGILVGRKAPWTSKGTAQDAYKYADAMLLERDVPRDTPADIPATSDPETA